MILYMKQGKHYCKMKHIIIECGYIINKAVVIFWKGRRPGKCYFGSPAADMNM